MFARFSNSIEVEVNHNFCCEKSGLAVILYSFVVEYGGWV